MDDTRSRILNPIIFALDVPNLPAAQHFIEVLGQTVGMFKIGLEAFTGPDGHAIVKAVKEAGGKFFLDLKFHDIPETARRAARNAAALGATFFSVHASGGREMLQAAVQGAAEVNPEVQVIAITVLTSLTAETMIEAGLMSRPPRYDMYCETERRMLVSNHMERLAKLADSAGCHGVVASPHEVELLRFVIRPEMLTIVPGIRVAGAATQDQARAGTAAQAARNGANYFVIGRPIRDAADPQAAALAFLTEIEKARNLKQPVAAV